MDHQEHHEMLLATTHPSGAEEWHCPTCGRRFLLKWPPTYKKIVLEPGDEYVSHSGGKGGLQMGHASMLQGEDTMLAAGISPGGSTEGQIETVELSEELLGPWANYIDNAGLDEQKST